MIRINLGMLNWLNVRKSIGINQSMFVKKKSHMFLPVGAEKEFAKIKTKHSSQNLPAQWEGKDFSYHHKPSIANRKPASISIANRKPRIIGNSRRQVKVFIYLVCINPKILPR